MFKRGNNSFRASAQNSIPRPNEELRLFKEKMNPLFERLPSDGNERRACMKFDKSPGDRFSETQKDIAQIIMKYARAYSFTAWYGHNPLMTDEVYVQTIKAILVDTVEVVSSSFFEQIMRMEQKTLFRFWNDFKSSQLKFMFSVFSHGGSVILTKFALAGFLVDFREKGAQERGFHGELDFYESTSRQRMQPCTSPFYIVHSDISAAPSIFSITEIDTHGNPVLDMAEEENGGWLYLTLSYVHKVLQGIRSIFQEIESTASSVLNSDMEFTLAKQILLNARPFLTTDDLLDVATKTRKSVHAIKIIIGSHSYKQMKDARKSVSSESHSNLTLIVHQCELLKKTLDKLLENIQKSPINILFCMMRFADGKYPADPFYARERDRTTGERRNVPLSYKQFRSIYTPQFFGMIYKFTAEMFYHRPHPLSSNVAYLEQLASANKTDILEEDEESCSTSCLEKLAELAARHFDNAFLSRTANARDHFGIFCDIWKYFHSGAPSSTQDEDRQEEEQIKDKDKEDDFMDEESKKRQRLSLGVPSMKDLQELNSSESEPEDENVNPNFFQQQSQANRQYTGVSESLIQACTFLENTKGV